MLQAFADFLVGPMHRQHGSFVAQEDFQMTALSGFKPAALLFEPAFELGAGHMVRVQQMCCIVNRKLVLYPSNSARPSSKRLAGVCKPYFMPPASLATPG